jgi:hypothetical protein
MCIQKFETLYLPLFYLKAFYLLVFLRSAADEESANAAPENLKIKSPVLNRKIQKKHFSAFST